MKCLKKKKWFVVVCEQINRKIPDPCNANTTVIYKKKTKSVKQSEIITYQAETFENPK